MLAPLGLELLMAVSCLVDAENQNWIPVLFTTEPAVQLP